jgi:hypothetical protein
MANTEKLNHSIFVKTFNEWKMADNSTETDGFHNIEPSNHLTDGESRIAPLKVKESKKANR